MVIVISALRLIRTLKLRNELLKSRPNYSKRNARIASAVLATAIPSVRPSVCLSVTRRYCVKTTARRTVQFAPLDSTRNPAIAEGPRDAGVPVEIW